MSNRFIHGAPIRGLFNKKMGYRELLSIPRRVKRAVTHAINMTHCVRILHGAETANSRPLAIIVAVPRLSTGKEENRYWPDSEVQHWPMRIK